MFLFIFKIIVFSRGILDPWPRFSFWDLTSKIWDPRFFGIFSTPEIEAFIKTLDFCLLDLTNNFFLFFFLNEGKIKKTLNNNNTNKKDAPKIFFQ